jgi:hypothetical protein
MYRESFGAAASKWLSPPRYPNAARSIPERRFRRPV